MRLNLNIRVNEDAQLVVRVTQDTPDGPLVFDPFVVSRADSLRIANWVIEARDAEEQSEADDGQRVVVATDGTKIRVVHTPSWSPTEGSWGALWTHGKRTFAGPSFGGDREAWDHEPTDADVLADYEAWKREKVR